MLLEYYPIKNLEELRNYLEVYTPLVEEVAEKLGIDLREAKFAGDHLGLQVISGDEFDQAHELILGYSRMIHDAMIHDRRNRVYRFVEPMKIRSGISFAGIEIFEPKPGADIRKLKPGIEHTAFKVDGYDGFYEECRGRNIPIDKSADMNGSKFFKTRLVNLVEIEFRNDFLGDSLQILTD